MTPIAHIARRAALAAVLACITLPARPQSPPSYTVEVVVFRNTGEGGALADTEVLPIASTDEVTVTPAGSRKLGGSVSKLNGGGLRVLGHGAWSQAPAAFQSRRGVSATRLGSAVVAGKVVLERDRYLHLILDLVVEDGGKRYRINEWRRRVTTGEVNYFDHPAIGILAIVTPD
jgi:hypothetical protein